MKLAIVGAGNLGTGLAKRLAPFGHQLIFCFGRDAEKLTNTARTFGAQSASVRDAVASAELVILTTPWAATAEALDQVGTPATGTVLWDCTNALKADMSGLVLGTTTSAGEEVARMAPWARVVKAIPPFAQLLHSDDVTIGGVRPGVMVCGNDAAARATVHGLVSQIGAEATDAGPLSNARYTEPMGMLLVQLAYMHGFGPRIGTALLRAA